LGSTEFLILLCNDPNDFVIADIVDCIIKAIGTPVDIIDWEIVNSARIGKHAFSFNTKYNFSYLIISTDSRTTKEFVTVGVNSIGIENPC